MITMGIWTYSGSNEPSSDSSGAHPSNALVAYTKNIWVMSVEREMPGHLCCPTPPGKYASGSEARESETFAFLVSHAILRSSPLAKNRSGANVSGSGKFSGSKNATRGSAVSTYPAGTSYSRNFRVVGLTRNPPAVCGTTLSVSLTTASQYVSFSKHRPSENALGSAVFTSALLNAPRVSFRVSANASGWRMSVHRTWPMFAAASMYAPQIMSTAVVATRSSGNGSPFSSVAVEYCRRKKNRSSLSSLPCALIVR